MYHRLSNIAGLGNTSPCILNNNVSLNTNKWDSFCEDFCRNYTLIGKYEGFDFQYTKESFLVGIEPTYMHDKLLIIKFDLKNKNNSSITKGIAFGPYGSQCVTKTFIYQDYKNKSKFVRFIDKWYDFVKNNLQETSING